MKEKVKRNVTIVPYCIGYHFTGKHDDGNIGEIIKKKFSHDLAPMYNLYCKNQFSTHTQKYINPNVFRKPVIVPFYLGHYYPVTTYIKTIILGQTTWSKFPKKVYQS